MIFVPGLHDILSYDPESGLLVWKERPVSMFPSERAWKMWNTRFAGKNASGPDGIGYMRLSIFKRRIRAHIVCWALANGKWPDEMIDHINGNRSDNRLCNLREATRSQNQMNRGKQSNNTSGCTGVRRHRSKWSARIAVEGKEIHLGVFSAFEEAVRARKIAECRFFGEYSHKGVA